MAELLDAVGCSWVDSLHDMPDSTCFDIGANPYPVFNCTKKLSSKKAMLNIKVMISKSLGGAVQLWLRHSGHDFECCRNHPWLLVCDALHSNIAKTTSIRM